MSCIDYISPIYWIIPSCGFSSFETLTQTDGKICKGDYKKFPIDEYGNNVEMTLNDYHGYTHDINYIRINGL